MRQIVIFGTGGMARDLHALLRDLVLATSRFEVLGFLDDDAAQHGRRVHDLPVLGGAEWIAANAHVEVAVGIGSPPAKRRVVHRLRRAGARFPSLVHPSAIVGPDVTLGEGAVVSAGCVLTTDISLGPFVTVNTACTLAHDDLVDPYATLAPGVHLAGNVHLRTGAELGIGAVAIQGVTVGEWSIVGAGAVVTTDLEPNVTAVGVPARLVKTRPPGWHE